MNEVPYLYINLLSLCSYVFILVTFLAAKKTPVIRQFIVVMIGFIFWTGGSVLMRLRVFPGIDFWYYVSILSLFVLALLIYFFVASFAKLKGYFLKIVLIICTFVLELLTALGLILDTPAMSVRPGGGIVFTYSIGWPILVPCLYFLFFVIVMLFVFRGIIKEKGARTPGLIEIIAGCAAVLLGNMLQLIPGNVFPYDTLSGIIFALLLMWAMYKKHMFQLSLLVSRSAVMIVGTLICILAASNVVGPVQDFLTTHYHISASTATTIIVVLFSLILSVVYLFIKKLIDALFTREEHQGRLIKSFSSEVSQSLNTGEIMDKLISIIKDEIPVKCIYVCLPQNGAFVASYSSEQLVKKHFSIAADSPCVKYLQKNEYYFIVSEFRKDPLYRSVWQSEKDLFNSLSLTCVCALKDGNDIVGLILFSEKDKSAELTYTELSFLETVSSIASIAVKNAGLYEQMYREARIDSLTGVYNYRFFVERISALYDECLNDSLALLFIDMDDFKLYNQLYGSVEGDKALRSVADIISLCVGDCGIVFRYSGKVFAALMPHYDGRQAELLAHEIRRRIDAINLLPDRVSLKPLSICCGICVSPYAASSAKELMENADLAVYNAKESGKDRIILFKGASPINQKVSDRALSIVENTGNLNVAYQANTSTIAALTAAIDSKDHYTYNHSRNVALYAAVLATAAGLNRDQISAIYEAGLLHDIGKISIPESILSKTGSLTSEEYSVMKSHVNNAIDIIRHLPNMDYVIPAAIGHHERWDGKGYPRGISGQDIPLSARCLAIADAFDAMTTDRPYRKGLTYDYAAEQIELNSGKQFDPELSPIFVRLIHEGELSSLARKI
ncbi:MAG: diguanylate cyclase [Oscillospiraceae bacterium]